MWRLRLWWSRLWVRKDEFHWTLDLDMDIYINLSEEKRKWYMSDLVRRRKIAHERDMNGRISSNPKRGIKKGRHIS